MSQQSQWLKDLLIIFNISYSFINSAVVDNTEKWLRFSADWGFKRCKLVVSAGQLATTRHCHCSWQKLVHLCRSREANYKAALFSAMPRLSLSPGRTSQVPSWTQGKTGVMPCFQTPKLSIRWFPSCHQPSKRETGDWKASAIWNKTPGFNRWGMSLPACILLLSIPSPCCYSGTQYFATESYLSIIKKPDLHVASSDRAYQLNYPELQAEVLTT